MRLFSIPALARRYRCTGAAIGQRAARLGIQPAQKNGHAYLYTAAQAKKLGPCKRGRPRGVKP